ncbi:MAG: ABC transporter ATP-binding protein [Christensenella sp.]
MEPIIAARNLKKIYRMGDTKIHALDGVDMDVMPGEICAILGTSGSGKSTLLSLLAGLEHPTSGKIFIKKKPTYKMNEKELVDFRLEHIGFVFQSFNLMPTMNAVENVALPLMFDGIGRTKRIKAAEKLLVQMGLRQQLKNMPNQLSGGQQQRVSIARAIISQPEIIFADEPTGNLDSVTAEQIMDIMCGEAKKRGSTLLFVTHDPSKAKYADQVIHIIDGKVAKREVRNSAIENFEELQGEKR